jgi:hypothetical protein
VPTARALLVIADIGGYTRFMRLHRLSLAHAQENTMHRAFHVEQQKLSALSLCPCDACGQIGSLTVKAVAHLGEVVEQTVRTKTTLVGPDVILVHRMLKNAVPIAEYVLMTDPVHERCDPQAREHAKELEAELEGLGAHRLWYIPLAEMAGEAAPPPRASLPRRLGTTGGQVVRALPYLVGVKRPRARPDA